MAESPEARQGFKQVSEAPIIGVETAPDLYIEGYQGAMIHNGVVKLNTYVYGIDPQTERNFRRVVAILTMPLPTLLQVHDAIGKLINEMERQGLVQRIEGAPDATEPPK